MIKDLTVVNLLNQKDLTVVNIYVPNIGACKYIKPKLTELKGKMNSNTRIVGNF